MKPPFQWRKPGTYLPAVGRARSRAVAGLRRKGKAPHAPVPPQLVGAVPPYSMAGPALTGWPFVRRWTLLSIFLLVLLALVAAAVTVALRELRTSQWQAKIFSEYAGAMRYTVQPGPGGDGAVRYPQSGPYDERLGYSRLPDYLTLLQAKDFQITAQARMSPQMVAAVDQGLFPPYREKAQAGLSIRDCRQQPLFVARYPERVYAGFDDVPALLVSTLLFVENRKLLDPQEPMRNPAVDWGRLGKATFDHAVHIFSPDFNSPGGSTLATQIEKYRHSPDGLTLSPADKLRQMASASLRAYQNGQDTSAVRHQLVVDYLNTVPLAARPGFGEVNGVGDGMWVWYGRDFAQVNTLLRSAVAATAPSVAEALSFKQVLSLVLAQRRPSYYLGDRESDLEALTDSHLRALATQGIISPALRDAALAVKLADRGKAQVAPPAVSFVTRKASTALRSQLNGLLGNSSFYNLDRLDLSVTSTLDARTQSAVTDVLRDLRNAESAKTAGLLGKGMLGRGDPAHVVYSMTLLERGERANYLRVQTDNFDQPLDINAGVKLDLGSTAKLRTLVTYLDVIAQLHQRLQKVDAAQRKQMEVDPKDHLTRWAVDYLDQHPEGDLDAMLQAALDRRYSASPAERFFTGGGVHTFNNFRKEDNNRVMAVREALRNSVNLVFVRLLRDVVHHYMFQVPGSSATLIKDAGDPRRAVYLSRFADREGREFIGRFMAKYQGKSAAQAQELLLQNVRPTPARLTSIFRTIQPNESMQSLGTFLEDNLPSTREVSPSSLAQLYAQYAPDQMSLADRGYIAGVHPLELWVVGYLRAHPGAKAGQVVAASHAERQAVYQWLFSANLKQAQDTRILSLLEVEGFLEIHRQWKRMGYPFGSLVPSYASALGASADRPAALAELMAILVNAGARKPTQRIETLHFGADTPYETVLQQQVSASEQVLAPQVAQATLGAIREVVEEGTARRLKQAFVRPDGSVIAVGGKTGTGDNRFDVFAARGQLIESRVVSRSATFVFNVGEQFFGSITAYVYGPQAADYDFTSALPVQLLKLLAPKLMPLMESGARPSASSARCTSP